MIEKVTNKEDANKCDELLTMLIADERQYDDTIDEKFIVKDYFCNVIENPDNILLCYKKNNDVVGYIYMKPMLDQTKKSYLIDGLFVKSEYRNKKIARNLLNNGIQILKNMNVEYIEIGVLNNNVIAKRLYHTLGFNDFKIKMRKEL